MLIPKCLLKGALLMAGVKDARYILNGVHVEQGNGGVWIVGTDGAAMFVAFHATSEVLDLPSMIIPRDALTAAFKLCKRPDLDVTGMSLGALAYSPIDGTYVDWRRVQPGAKLSGKWPVAFNADLLAQAVKAVTVANDAPHNPLNVGIHPDTDKFVLVGARPKCLVVAMAARFEAPPHAYEPLGA